MSAGLQSLRSQINATNCFAALSVFLVNNLFKLTCIILIFSICPILYIIPFVLVLTALETCTLYFFRFLSLNFPPKTLILNNLLTPLQNNVLFRKDFNYNHGPPNINATVALYFSSIVYIQRDNICLVLHILPFHFSQVPLHFIFLFLKNTLFCCEIFFRQSSLPLWQKQNIM